MAASRPLNTPRAVQRRRQLVEAATSVFADRDYDDVSVDEVAAQAGVSHGLVFQHFGSKKALYVEGVRAILANFQEATRPDAGLPPQERLRAVLRAYFRVAAAHPIGFRSLARTAGAFAEVHELLEQARARRVDQLARGLGLDRHRPAVRIALRGWIGQLDATCVAWLEAGAPAEEVEMLVDVMVAALLQVGEQLRR